MYVSIWVYIYMGQNKNETLESRMKKKIRIWMVQNMEKLCIKGITRKNSKISVNDVKIMKCCYVHI